jgi:hypothetical protein
MTHTDEANFMKLYHHAASSNYILVYGFLINDDETATVIFSGNPDIESTLTVEFIGTQTGNLKLEVGVEVIPGAAQPPDSMHGIDFICNRNNKPPKRKWSTAIPNKLIK